MNGKTNISIGKTNYPDGTKKIKARVKELGTAPSDIVLDFEKRFNELREILKKQVKKTDIKTGDALNHWMLGDMVLEFEEYADKQGFLYNTNTQPLVKYVGKSEAYWMLHKKFRRVYPSKESINQKIPFKMYLWLIREPSDENRKLLERHIASGKLQNQQELQGLLHLSKDELFKQLENGKKKPNKTQMTPSHLMILEALKESDMNQYEIAEHTGLSRHGVRGRITELRHRFHCNIKIVDGIYHLDDNG